MESYIIVLINNFMYIKNLENNYAFIDSQNLNLGVRSQGWILDFQRFRVFLKDKYKIKKAFIFIGYVMGNESLYTELQQAGYICIFKPTLEIKKNKNKKVRIKGNVDAELVLHTMIQYDNFNKAIIVSGDGDFHCLIGYLIEKKKLLKMIAPNKKYSSLLKKFAFYVVNIQLFKEKLIK